MVGTENAGGEGTALSRQCQCHTWWLTLHAHLTTPTQVHVAVNHVSPSLLLVLLSYSNTAKRILLKPKVLCGTLQGLPNLDQKPISYKGPQGSAQSSSSPAPLPWPQLLPLLTHSAPTETRSTAFPFVHTTLSVQSPLTRLQISPSHLLWVSTQLHIPNDTVLGNGR